ncbi:hypothetical protein BF38_5458 (plasmid) [Bacillus thuringiensis]|uniref:Uncharacterized protein n=1 Tax=Bacillus thuringiensis TaxID=1428 RepID=A0AB33B5Q5_BACTU|nr:hypothetical protein BF38_5458 [Bacillus thuringiensis]
MAVELVSYRNNKSTEHLNRMLFILHSKRNPEGFLFLFRSILSAYKIILFYILILGITINN